MGDIEIQKVEKDTELADKLMNLYSVRTYRFV